MAASFIIQQAIRMFAYACLRDTQSPSSQYLTHKENNLCLENKDTITHNHSQAPSFWLDNRTQRVRAVTHIFSVWRSYGCI